MFGLKADWSLEVFERYFTLGDYAGGEVRWCSGCGDFAILNTVHRVLRDAQVPPEKGVAVFTCIFDHVDDSAATSVAIHNRSHLPSYATKWYAHSK